MKHIRLLFLAALMLAFNGCFFEDVDDQKPEIDLAVEGAFPINCDTLYFGATFTFRALFTDNAELGSYSIDIHHNFDHHSHTTETSGCNLWPVQVPSNPFQLTVDYSIPELMVEFQAAEEITVPAANGEGLFDEGEYHLFIRLTDREGWSAQKGLSIKMLHRE
ncbi:MAG: DUF4625 domain-containing protein [Bacteroidales bacterium]|nr:DUF4625 domain-containing protein [Bacteroidales bacterium]